MELNQKVADFSLQTDENKTVSLSDYAGKPVILFFYPRADTPGCTIEACGFRDTFKKLQAAGAVVLGHQPGHAQRPSQIPRQVQPALHAPCRCRRESVQSVWRAEGKEHVRQESVGHRADHVCDRPGPDPAAHLPQGYARRATPKRCWRCWRNGRKRTDSMTPRSQTRDLSKDSGQALGHPGPSLRPPLPRAFFEAPPEEVAPRLLGKVLAHSSEGGLLAGRIVEAEAYLGPHNRPPDPAAHSYRGPTPRNSVLFGPAGHAYVYSIYGRYYCMNISCEVEGRAGCVLLRALEPLTGADGMALNRGLAPGSAPRQLTSGPSRLCQALGLTRAAHNGLDLLDPASPLQVRDGGDPVAEVMATPRIGVHVAVDWPLRFVLSGHPCVSGPKNLTGKRIHLQSNSVHGYK